MEQRKESESDNTLAVMYILKMTSMENMTLLVGESHRSCVILVKGTRISGL